MIIKPTKCISYVGNLELRLCSMRTHDLETLEAKIEAIQIFPEPDSASRLSHLQGINHYYRPYVSHSLVL